MYDGYLTAKEMKISLGLKTYRHQNKHTPTDNRTLNNYVKKGILEKLELSSKVKLYRKKTDQSMPLNHQKNVGYDLDFNMSI